MVSRDVSQNINTLHTSAVQLLTYSSAGDHSVVGEATWQGYKGLTYFDVSAVDSKRNDNIHWLINAGWTLSSGCDVFPCGDSYTVPGGKPGINSLLARNMVCKLTEFSSQIRKPCLPLMSILSASLVTRRFHSRQSFHPSTTLSGGWYDLIRWTSFFPLSDS
jgi:hypothetical protein